MEELEIIEGESPEQNPRDQSAPVEAEPEAAPALPQVLMMEAVEADELLSVEDAGSTVGAAAEEDAKLKAVMEALVYVAEDPIMVAQVAASLEQPAERIRALLDQLIAEFDKPEHGIQIREVAGGYRMATKAEHHDAVRAFVKSLKPPLKLSLPALETLAVIAYKQPVTAPEIKEIRGVQGTGVLSTLLDRKLIAEAGRKNVIGKPILYKTTKEFLIQFGLRDLAELPTLKEFEEIRRMAFADSESVEAPPTEAITTPVVEGPTGAEVDAAADEAKTIEVEEQSASPESEPTIAAVETEPAEAELPVAPDGTSPAEAETTKVVIETRPVEAEATAATGEPEPAQDQVSDLPSGGAEQPAVPPAPED